MQVWELLDRTSLTAGSFNGRASVSYQVARNLGLNASYTHYLQDGQGLSGAVPEVRSNRFSVGMTWSFR